MSLLLTTHSKNYNLSFCEGLASFCTISGAVYAKRHWELSLTQEGVYSALGHRLIAVIETIPLIGALAALIERICAYVCNTLFNNPTALSPIVLPPSETQPGLSAYIKPQVGHVGARLKAEDPTLVSASAIREVVTFVLDTDGKETLPLIEPSLKICNIAFQKMLKNSQKALDEHRRALIRDPANSSDDVYAKQVLTFSPEAVSDLKPLTFEYCEAVVKGTTEEMKSRHFFAKIDEGIILGVLDGHGSSEVANFVAKEFQTRFSSKLKTLGRNVKQTFEEVFEEIDAEVIKHEEWRKIGSTAVISFIDKTTQLIYTATLGDSEATIYRKEPEKLQSIPLSCVRNWSCKKEATRAATALENPFIIHSWTKAKHPKWLKYADINVSRSIGYAHAKTHKSEFIALPSSDVSTSNQKIGLVETPLPKGMPPPISCKPKVTVNLLKAGDMLVFTCGLLKEHLSEAAVVSSLKASFHDKNLAHHLVNRTFSGKKPSSTVSAIVVKIS